ncbi:MAG: hypothetical protein IT389_14190 [Nitrospira sp.]|nr:hypothetical protein [Nitrospira sp.]
MLALLWEYWGTGLFWLIAAGFSVSDIHNQTLQFIFWGLGLIFIIPPLWKGLEKISVIPGHLNPSPARTSFDKNAKKVFIATVMVLLASWFGFLYYVTRPIPHPLQTTPLRNVHNVTFTKEVVKVDGNAFFDCTFNDVIFLYNGTTHFQIERPTIKGKVTISTSNFETSHVMQFLGSLGALKNGFVTQGPEN